MARLTKEERQHNRLIKARERLIQLYETRSNKLIEELEPYAKGEISVKKLYKRIELLDKNKEALKTALPFLKGSLMPDTLVLHTLDTAEGPLSVSIAFQDGIQFHTEFIYSIPFNIPKAAILRRGGLGVHIWGTSDGTELEDEEYCVYLKDMKDGKGFLAPTPIRWVEWKQTIGNKQYIRSKWGYQLIPFKEKQTIFIHKKTYDTGAFDSFSKFGVDKAFEAYNFFKKLLPEYKYDGEQGKPDCLNMTFSLQAIPDLTDILEYSDFMSILWSDEPPPLELPQKKTETTKPEIPAIESPTSNDPINIAKTRLANGEISIEEFENIKSALS